MRRFRIATLLTTVVLVAAACGSSSSSGVAKGSSTSTSSRISSTTAAPSGDVALAKAGLVTQADLPDFTANPATTKKELDEIDALAKTLPACQRFMAAKQDGDVQRRSPQWAQNHTTVDSGTDVYADVATITAQLELYRDPTIIDCYRALYTEVVTKSLS